jgi:outer membrane receptor protein involved in Fe transport
VAFYENEKFQVRAAYNWRDEFLARRFDGGGLPNPIYTEAYGQLDVNASYNWNDNLTLMAEAINLTDEIYRQHSRTSHQVIMVQQTGPRFMIGARYKFGN